MKFRTVTIFSGHVFEVPQSVQRIDHRATHGWSSSSSPPIRA